VCTLLTSRQVRVSAENYKLLTKLKGWLEQRDGKTYSIDAALGAALKLVRTENLPPIEEI
jgi:hypothetical protein